MSNAFTWTCPQCGRIVPRRVAGCRCGYVQEALPPAEPAPAPAPPTPAPPGSGRNNALIAAAAVVAVAIVASAGLVSVTWLKTRPSVADAAPSPITPVAEAPPPADPLADLAPLLAEVKEPPLPSIEELVTKSLSAVVKVETERGMGSAFFVSPDTLITNAHVVGGASTVILRMRDGVTRPAVVERVSQEVDLAILKAQIVDRDQIFLALGRPADLRVGNEVIAIGSPLGLQNTVTRGIVSGTRDVVDRFMGTRISLIQTDAAINPGNSGGPLIDRYGRVIGVNTLKLGGRAEAIGFAVSVHYARPLLGPSFKLKTDEQQRAENGLRTYDDSVRRIAVMADQYEERWKAFRAHCYAGDVSAEPRVREWLVLADGDQSLVKNAPMCSSWKPVFYSVSRSLREAMLQYAQKAAEAGVPAEKMLAVRRQYNMAFPGWE